MVSGRVVRSAEERVEEEASALELAASDAMPLYRLCKPRKNLSTLRRAIDELMVRACAAHPPPSAAAVAKGGSWWLPLPQMGAVEVDYERKALSWLLRHACAIGRPASPSFPMLLSSPYLNLPREYSAPLTAPLTEGTNAQQSPATPPTLLSGSPSSSGFYGAVGPKGLIPHVYTALEEQLTSKAREHGRLLRLCHYERLGWTYHAKGLWLWPPPLPERVGGEQMGSARVGGEGAGPVLTVIGSSNFSERSVTRDVELSGCLVTSDGRLRAMLSSEQARLLKHSRPADPQPASTLANSPADTLHHQTTAHSHGPPPSLAGFLSRLLASVVRPFL